MDIVSASDDDKREVTKTLKLLYKYFSEQLHALVRENIRRTKAPNSLFALSITKNMKFIKLLLSLFKQEAISFVNYHDANQSNLQSLRFYEFHLVYSMCKSGTL